jgi:hypothetical protein
MVLADLGTVVNAASHRSESQVLALLGGRTRNRVAQIQIARKAR